LGYDHPPVIYPGSIERVDFGEAKDDKFFVIASIERGKTIVEWRQLENIRPFVDRFIRLEHQEQITEQLLQTLPEPDDLNGAIVRLVLEYPREWEALIDEAALRDRTSQSFEFHLVKRPQMETRIRLPEGQAVGSLTPLELLDKYWGASHTEPDDREALNQLASQIVHSLETDQE
jgi:exonuclease SbcD